MTARALPMIGVIALSAVAMLFFRVAPASAAASCGPAVGDATKITCIYSTVGADSFVVPAGVTFVDVVAVGGAGGRAYAAAGNGAVVTTRNLPVSAGATLTVFIGGGGAKSGTMGAGGGSTNVQAGTANQIIAGGGGGSSFSSAGGDAGLSGGQGGDAPSSGGRGGANGVGGLGTGYGGSSSGGSGSGGAGGSTNAITWPGGAGVGTGVGGSTGGFEGGNGGGGYGGGGAGGAVSGSSARGGGGGGSVGPVAIATATTTTYAIGTNAPGSDSTPGGAGSLRITFTVQTQTLAFTSTAPTAAAVGDTYAVLAAATSGLPVAFSIAGGSTGVCSIDGNVISFVGAGTCSILGDQPGSADYLAAAQVEQSFRVTAPVTPTSSAQPAPLTSGPIVVLDGTAVRTRLTLPVPGQLVQQPRTMRGKRATMTCSQARSAPAGTAVTLTCLLTAAGRERLRRGPLALWLTTRYIPDGGSPQEYSTVLPLR